MIRLNQREQLGAGIALILLLALTRGQHFASVDALPSASWAVFFLAGVLLKPIWGFPLLFLEAVALDITVYGLGNAAASCITPAYGMLVPAYASLWYAGRVYARKHSDQFSTVVPLAGTLLVGSFIGNLFSSGGYYFLSGKFEVTTLLGMVERIEMYYPAKLWPLIGYTLITLGAVYAYNRFKQVQASHQV